MSIVDKPEFSGRVAVVTGGTEGLGRHFCRSLAALACEVYFCARNPPLPPSSESANSHYFQADVADPEQIAAFAEHVRNAAGRVDYLINNVALDDRCTLENITPEIADRMWMINTRSYLLTTHDFLELLRLGDGKSIVNIGTTNYMIGQEPFTLYGATKSAILGFTRSLARELGKEGIRANMVSPGWVMTQKQLDRHVTEQDKSDLIRDQSLKFLLEPGHITPAVLFLLSQDAGAITGQNLVVDAGKFMY